ncbi:putative ORFan [Tupanvirus deep ocean]|uniref:ORFan n=2 Tax=Tupanvirus TaxID=2094720 RepID=A0AC62AA05_9VIRU|nr:putative ORFan [Tupanvirus deep ocean]QKU34554.1 putative ORFan [Tupanvirus deep ocean]
MKYKIDTNKTNLLKIDFISANECAFLLLFISTNIYVNISNY